MSIADTQPYHYCYRNLPKMDEHRSRPSAAPASSDNSAPTDRHWDNGLCGCCSPVSLCLTSCFLPCLTFGKTHSRVRNPSLEGFSYCNTDCMLYCGLSLIASHWIIQTIRRGEVRNKFGIDGNYSSDCCTAFWCSCCAIVQEEKEVELRTRPRQPGYQQNSPMVMP